MHFKIETVVLVWSSSLSSLLWGPFRINPGFNQPGLLRELYVWLYFGSVLIYTLYSSHTRRQVFAATFVELCEWHSSKSTRIFFNRNGNQQPFEDIQIYSTAKYLLVCSIIDQHNTCGPWFTKLMIQNTANTDHRLYNYALNYRFSTIFVLCVSRLLYYLRSDDRDVQVSLHGKSGLKLNFGMSVFQHVSSRQVRIRTTLDESYVTNLTARRIPSLLKEREIPLGRTDKVFASQWLDGRKIVCGTKSNQLLVLDALSGWKVSIPVLEGSCLSPLPEMNCGIHSIKVSPDRKLLASSGHNPNHLAVYRVPSFDPVCIGEVHSDWIFAIEWIDDVHLATGSRDGTIALWCIQDSANQIKDQQLKIACKFPAHVLHSPLRQCKREDKIRDLVYERTSKTLVALSALGYIHLWDMNTCQQKSNMPLKYSDETVCLGLDEDNRLFAVGSQSHVSCYDARCSNAVGFITSCDPGAGIRSLSFRDLLLTVGTGLGSLFFFDVRSCRFLEHNGTNEMICLKAGRGWLREDMAPFDYVTEFNHACSSNAIYTHCYDPTGTKLFAAGGPLSLAYYGNYAALWE